MEMNAPEIRDVVDSYPEASDKLNEFEVANNNLESNLLQRDISLQPSVDHHNKMVPDSTEKFSAINKYGLTYERRKIIQNKAKVMDEDQSNDQIAPDNGSAEILTQGNATTKRKRMMKKKKMNGKNTDEVQFVDQEDILSNLHLLERNQGPCTDCKLPANDSVQESESSEAKEQSSSNVGHNKEIPLKIHFHEQTVCVPDAIKVFSTVVCSEFSAEKSDSLARPMNQGIECLPREHQHITQPNLVAGETLVLENGASVIDSEMVIEDDICSVKGSSVKLSCDAKEATHLSSLEVKEVYRSTDEMGNRARIAPVVTIKRKLLVLDVNGLLAHIVMPAPKDGREDTRILGRAIFKRPYCDDFLKFCFQNFDVGIWSSRAKKIIDRVVEYLFEDQKDKLLFCWDMMHSTQTGFKTLENYHKPLVCKELRKIWEPDEPTLPWKKGDYDESNTLLLDDSPYKALLNPVHTAIFPNSYQYEDKNDNSLGPGGDIRVYLEGLLTAENVQKYVEQNPFGQSAINETNIAWEFYSVVLQTLYNQKESNNIYQLPTLS